jgi:hypothetical protein
MFPFMARPEEDRTKTLGQARERIGYEPARNLSAFSRQSHSGSGLGSSRPPSAKCTNARRILIYYIDSMKPLASGKGSAEPPSRDGGAREMSRSVETLYQVSSTYQLRPALPHRRRRKPSASGSVSLASQSQTASWLNTIPRIRNIFGSSRRATRVACARAPRAR